MKAPKRIAIVNRGEAAMRLIHTVAELQAGGQDVRSIALYTDEDAASMFVREADEVHCLGPASGRPYLNYDLVIGALREVHADAAWVGWGFVSEDAQFAQRCQDAGITFIGPSAAAMQQLGDKIGAKQLAEQCQVPVAAWSGGSVDSLEAAADHAHHIGYPLMLKAAAGGGGRGIRKVNSDAELAAVFDLTRAEAQRAFGSDVVFLESVVTNAKHVEVQIISDGQQAWALGVRDCSAQRRNQKVIEESACALLTTQQEEELRQAAIRLALAVKYRGAGTVEFLYQVDRKEFAFLEVNTRLQVEHPVTELVTGTDLVALQLHIAAGGTLEGQVPPAHGHAIEVRLNAEDPEREFAPSPGRISLLQFPCGPGIRIDTAVSTGDTIAPQFDSMIAKIIAYAPTREGALVRLRRALRDTTVVIESGASNVTFLIDLLDDPQVAAGQITTGWIDQQMRVGQLLPRRHAAIALLGAAIDAYDEAELHDLNRFLVSAHGGHPQAEKIRGKKISLAIAGNTYHLTVAKTDAQCYDINVNGHCVSVRLERLAQHRARMDVADQHYRLVLMHNDSVHTVQVNDATHRITRDEGGIVRSTAPALVVALPVSEGESVPAGAPLVVLESMKMETVIRAPHAGRVHDIRVHVTDQVHAGQPLLALEQLVDTTDSGDRTSSDNDTTRLSFAAIIGEPTADRLHRALSEVRRMMMGYDFDPVAVQRELTDTLIDGKQGTDKDSGESSSHECINDDHINALSVFADLCELTRNHPHADHDEETRIHSPREFFHRYLHSLDVQRENLPSSFTTKLLAGLAHYHIDSLERTRQLELAIYRIFLSQQYVSSIVTAVNTILQRWLTSPVPADGLTDRCHHVLDQLFFATQARFPAIADLARQVRHHWFEEPVARVAREQAYAKVHQQLDYLAQNPDAPDYLERIDTLAASPEPLMRFLSERINDSIDTTQPLLNVLVRRHYGSYELANLRSLNVSGRAIVTADYVMEGNHYHLMSTIADSKNIAAMGPLLTKYLPTVPGNRQLALDVYVAWPPSESGPEPDTLAAQVKQRLEHVPALQPLHRITVTLCVAGTTTVRHFTFYRNESDQLLEDVSVRGLHPMVARRINVWRLRDFDTTRIESPSDVYLYRCVAPDNPSDIRLVAIAQIRELTVIRDSHGNVTSIPQAEQAIASCLDAIRHVRSATADQRHPLDMNHIWLYLWPAIDVPVAELTQLKNVIAPRTGGAGISEIVAQGHVISADGTPTDVVARFYRQSGVGVQVDISGRPTQPLAPLNDYDQKVLRSRRRRVPYPYELISHITAGGSWQELDLADDASLVVYHREPGRNKAAVVVGIATARTATHPEGMRRVVIMGDPTKSLGSLAAPECTRIMAALNLAEREHIPVEWFALSSGAKIAMDSGTENMDAIARTLRRIVEFTQNGGEINIIVTGINVGAQPYWNAEATMLMHTKGILVMTPESAMVLTGKTSLDYSGGVSAEDNFGIGGYDRVMGPNGQAQYWAKDIATAIGILFNHYEHSYIALGERWARQAVTSDPNDRNICDYPHPHTMSDFMTVGDIFCDTANPERKKPFDIRTVMRAVCDQDHPLTERWADMAEAEMSVVADAHLGGYPVCLIGIESHPVARHGYPPADGPDTWTAGTLFPQSSRKTARAINSASGRQPVVVLANLSGFDGSPESMRLWQLEYGAEIGRAIVNFDGPIVFCVISRYHGGAFVVFSKQLNPNLHVLAVEGSFASVIGGAPAAGVVFTREVDARTDQDERVIACKDRIEAAADAEKAQLRVEISQLWNQVRSEKLTQLAAEFDGVHSIERAVAVGSVDDIIPATQLRPALIEAIEQGLQRAQYTQPHHQESTRLGDRGEHRGKGVAGNGES